MKPIKNIIFDLGDVIINIDVPLASSSFAALSDKPLEEVRGLIIKNEVFKKFETGHLTATEFRDYIRQLLHQPEWKDEDIDMAWNSLLLDIPSQRIQKLQELAQKGYRLFLLSNTSSIHIEEVNQILNKTTGVQQLNDLFEKLYLSYEMGIMKPADGIYEQLLADANIMASETLFLDDNADNIQAASTLGIHTIHVQKPLTMLEYLKDY